MLWLIILLNNLAWLNIVIACKNNFWEKDAPGIAFYVFFVGVACGFLAIIFLGIYVDEQDNIKKKLNKKKK